MRASLQSLTRRITWLLLVALLLPTMGAAMSGGTGARFEMLVCSGVGSPIAADLGGEDEPERPAGADHCVFCSPACCAPPAATTHLVAEPGNATAAVAQQGSVHLPDPPRWLKFPVRAPPASIS